MLAKKQKLNLKETSFRLLAQKGFRWRGAGMQAAYVFHDKNSQAAVLIPKVIAPKAATRNALRREIYDQLKGILQSVNIQLIIRVERGERKTLDLQLEKLFQEIQQEAEHGK